VELDLFHGDGARRLAGEAVGEFGSRLGLRPLEEDGIGTVQGERLELASRAARSSTLVADDDRHSHRPAVPESTEIAWSSAPAMWVGWRQPWIFRRLIG
jgi:hypothetical protein